VEAQNGLTLDSVKVVKTGDKISQSFTMEADKYDESVVALTGHITCAPKLYGTQTENVYVAYGNKFENIVSEGSLIWNASGNIVVFASEPVELKK
jgi:hypothetical protein